MLRQSCDCYRCSAECTFGALSLLMTADSIVDHFQASHNRYSTQRITSFISVERNGLMQKLILYLSVVVLIPTYRFIVLTTASMTGDL